MNPPIEADRTIVNDVVLEATGERVVLGRSGHATHGYELEHLARYEFARAYATTGVVVDVACGTGYGSALLGDAGADIVRGYDVDPQTIAFAEKEWGSPKTSFAVADASELPENDASVDVVVSFETIEHLSSPAGFIAELGRILRPGGTLLLSTPDRDVYNWADHRDDGGNPFHVSELTPKELRALLRARFSIVRMLGQGAVPDYPSLYGRISRLASIVTSARALGGSGTGATSIDMTPAPIRGPVKYRVVVARRRGENPRRHSWLARS